MESTETLPIEMQAQICGCCIDQVLAEDRTFLAVGPGGRNVVLKTIDPDCLLRGALHPHVRDRLGRVRELAHASVANLFGVEREAGTVYLIWEYVEGVAFDLHAGANRSPREVASTARELVMAVDLLHMQGIVHGALIGANVIVAPDGGVRLTHISPLLYTDPNVDIECVWNLLEQAAEELGERGTALATLVSDSRKAGLSLRQLAGRLGGLIDTRDAKKIAETEVEPAKSLRRRAMVGAAVVTLAGVAAAWGVWRAVETGHFPMPDNHGLPFHGAAQP